MHTDSASTENKQVDQPLSFDKKIMTPEPGALNVIKRNGKVAPYDDSKINVAMTKAFLAVEGQAAAQSDRIHEIVNELRRHISDNYLRRHPTGATLHIEEIQDQVELMLMRHGHQKVARAYVLYREEHRKARQAKAETKSTEKVLNIKWYDGSSQPLDIDRMRTVVQEACQNLSETKSEKIVDDALKNLFDGAHINDVSKALILTARTLIEKEPQYSQVSARLLLDQLRTEVLQHLKIKNEATSSEMATLYPNYFKAFIQHGIDLQMIDPALAKFDLDVIGQALKAERDLQFTYLGLQTLYDRYFLHDHGVRYEMPQALFMRVAMGLALKEKEKEKAAIEFYNLLSSFDYMSATPTLFNSGTVRPQLSSCFLTTVPDDLEGIYNAIRDNAMLSKFAGGLGNDWTPVRALGSHIKGTNGQSLGVVPFMNVADATAIAVNQGGKRKGAVCGYLETWHMDIEEFLELRKNTGDDRRRTHDMHLANWIPDLFMKRVFNDEAWTLFSPNDVPKLHDSYGEVFEQHYLQYEAMAKDGKIKHHKTIPAKTLWRKMLSMLFETGHPWMTFKDPCNIRSPQGHTGVVHSSNLCTEITLNTSDDEIAVCNLGSINLPQHVENGKLNTEKLAKTIKTAVRMLDNVIDINYYTVPQAKNANQKHRPIGLGIMGFQDALYKLGIDYASDDAILFADKSMEYVSYHAIEASCQLAKKRGSYATFDGSLWSQGILPIDSIKLLKGYRQAYLEQDQQSHTDLDWDGLREAVRTHGMRNSNVMAIAPTATISNICGVSQSIEPTYQNLFVKSNLSGEFTVVNPYLIKALKTRGLWDDVMVNDLKYFNGSVANINRVPQDLKKRFATSFEIDVKWLVEAASRRQKWIDQGQSLNLYIAEPSGKKLDKIYRMAWLCGLKTTYYLRSIGATSTEKATIHDSNLNAVKIENVSETPKACAIDDPDCEACQ